MKLILISILLFTGFSNTDLIEQIRNEYNLINKSLDSYTKVENNDINVYKDLNPDNYSYESEDIYRLAMINLIRYYDNGEIKKAVVNFNGDRQDLISEYYYKNNSLFFVFKTQIDYKNPKWSDDFNGADKKVLENRFYFNGEKLIKWIDSGSNMTDLKTVDKIIIENIISDSELYKSIK
ncbi:hypothetical protein [Marinifilum sp. D737]|uniref:hypothetical protein n=1 Tax=Marinifilum sp. D737 TaxID=2969628 RepID=UPI0022743082|nr:hypothetical protein [Marinifilum sp. D737]MCY1636497.1 hypothetical protein [Marinifilum sp. D737]